MDFDLILELPCGLSLEMIEEDIRIPDWTEPTSARCGNIVVQDLPPLLGACAYGSPVFAVIRMEILSAGDVLQSDHVRLVAGLYCPFLSVAAVTLVLDGDAGRLAARLVGEDQAV